MKTWHINIVKWGNSKDYSAFDFSINRSHLIKGRKKDVLKFANNWLRELKENYKRDIGLVFEIIECDFDTYCNAKKYFYKKLWENECD